MMAERSATDMALADAFAEAGVDIKSSLGVCKQDLYRRASATCCSGRRTPAPCAPTCRSPTCSRS